MSRKCIFFKKVGYLSKILYSCYIILLFSTSNKHSCNCLDPSYYVPNIWYLWFYPVELFYPMESWSFVSLDVKQYSSYRRINTEVCFEYHQYIMVFPFHCIHIIPFCSGITQTEMLGWLTVRFADMIPDWGASIAGGCRFLLFWHHSYKVTIIFVLNLFSWSGVCSFCWNSAWNTLWYNMFMCCTYLQKKVNKSQQYSKTN